MTITECGDDADLQVSFVVCGRNDNYGEGFLDRFNVFVEALAQGMVGQSYRAELIIVDWNPPSDTDSLKDAIQWPCMPPNLLTRIVTVPHTIHNRLENSERFGLFEYRAKNVGLARAKGKLVVVTNPDILFSKALIRFLGKIDPAERVMYRVDRYDFSSPLPLLGRSWCIKLILAGMSTFSVSVQKDKRRTASRVSISKIRAFLGVVLGFWPRTALAADFGRVKVYLSKDLKFGSIHTMASGDFICAPKFAWEEINGFAEYTDTFNGVDSCACYQFVAAGMSQAILSPPLQIFHQDHDRKEHAERPSKDREALQTIWRKLLKKEISPKLNRYQWGEQEESLDEFQR